METPATPKKKPVRSYTSQQLQDIVSNPDQHPAKKVEACRREIEIREESRKYKKAVETYDNSRIEDIITNKSEHPEALVYRCQVERRRRAKQAAADQASTTEPTVQTSWWKRKTEEAKAGVTDLSMGYLYAGLAILFGLGVIRCLYTTIFGNDDGAIFLNVLSIIATILIVIYRKLSLTPAAKAGLLMSLLGPVIGFIGMLMFINNTPINEKLKKILTISCSASLTVTLLMYLLFFGSSSLSSNFYIYEIILITASLLIAAVNAGFLLFVCLTDEKDKMTLWWQSLKKKA